MSVLRAAWAAMAWVVVAGCGDSSAETAAGGGGASMTTSSAEATATAGSTASSAGAGGEGPGATSGASGTTTGAGAGGAGGGPAAARGCEAVVAADDAIFVRPALEDDATTGVEHDGDGSSWEAATAEGGPGARRGVPSDGTNQGLVSSDLRRGASYYLAGGSYPGMAFDDPNDGETPIRIFTATQENAGAVAGWVDALEGQVRFGDYLAFATGYYELDGQTRNGEAWDDDASYGVRVATIVAHWDNFPPGGHFITIGCASIGGTPGAGYSPDLSNGVALAGSDEAVHDWTIRHSYLHETRTAVHMSGFRGATIEHCHIGPSWSKEAIIGIYTAYDVVVRNNVFVDNCQDVPDDPTAQGCTAEVAAFNSQGGGNYDRWTIHGNLFGSRTTRATPHSDGVILGGGGTSTASSWRVFNNVITRLDSTGGLKNVGIHLSGSDNLVYNNLWFDLGEGSSIGCDATACESNGCFSGSAASCDGIGAAPVLGDGDPFVDAEGFDYRLRDGAWAVDAGKDLTDVPGFDAIDPAGAIRGEDGAWDLGVFER